MKIEEVLACSFSEWYPLLRKSTFPSKILPLPQEFVDYLLADNLVLRSNQALLTYEPEEGSSSDSDDDNDAAGWDEAEKESPALDAPHFKELDEQIASVIAGFGGKTFVKLNWSSPKDASWIALNNSLECVIPADVHLLLKSSDFTLHDLTQPFKDCEDFSENVTTPFVKYELILRKWMEINPGTEFRCFVFNKCLIGICQRDATQFYLYIGKEKDDIVRDISSFFSENIHPKFPLDNYVFDVVRHCKDKVSLVDVNPYGITTDSLLFDWEELLSFQSDSTVEKPDFRYISEESGIRSNPLRRYCFPEDINDLTSGEDPFKLIDLLNLQARINDGDSDSSDD